MPEEGGFLVLASNFGQERPPSWFHNVAAHPDVHVVVDGSRTAVRAAVLDGADREAILPVVAAYSSQWRRYLATVDRQIPILRLSRR
jgi:deazaflavin-dependent oxidoreductase (nitroreductase family)